MSRILIVASVALMAQPAIDLHFADGVVAAQVGDGSGPVSFQKAKRVERKRASPYPQPGLFDEG